MVWSSFNHFFEVSLTFSPSSPTARRRAVPPQGTDAWLRAAWRAIAIAWAPTRHQGHLLVILPGSEDCWRRQRHGGSPCSLIFAAVRETRCSGWPVTVIMVNVGRRQAPLFLPSADIAGKRRGQDKSPLSVLAQRPSNLLGSSLCAVTRNKCAERGVPPTWGFSDAFRIAPAEKLLLTRRRAGAKPPATAIPAWTLSAQTWNSKHLLMRAARWDDATSVPALPFSVGEREKPVPSIPLPFLVALRASRPRAPCLGADNNGGHTHTHTHRHTRDDGGPRRVGVTRGGGGGGSRLPRASSGPRAVRRRPLRGTQERQRWAPRGPASGRLSLKTPFFFR